jgi:hypothetical protein
LEIALHKNFPTLKACAIKTWSISKGIHLFPDELTHKVVKPNRFYEPFFTICQWNWHFLVKEVSPGFDTN